MGLDAREISFSFLVGYPKWKVRCSTAASFLQRILEFKDSPVGLGDKYYRW